jgi:protein-L-isoaspartate(D-aspartate) O-methyltransferase
LGKLITVAIASAVLITPGILAAEGIDWQVAVARLAAERTYAETRVGLLKRNGDPAQVSRGELVYAAGTPPSDGQPDPASAPDFAAQRARMVRLIRLEAELTRGVTGVGAIGPRVLAAMAEVPRHRFVPEPLAPYAYLPRPLPVHPEQNLAAPFLVALMTDLAQVEPHHRVLETGTGEGYHAAVLDRLAAEVHSVEVIPELARAAGGRLAALGYGKVRVHEGDGYDGWPAAAPFDAIIVKEAVDHVPAPLLAQLRPGGRLVLPLGPPDGPQQLTVVRRGAAAGAAREERVLPVRFTPLQGGERI